MLTEHVFTLPFHSPLIGAWVLAILADPQQNNIIAIQAVKKITPDARTTHENYHETIPYWIVLPQPIPFLSTLEFATTQKEKPL
jgi:hypothetical protein